MLRYKWNSYEQPDKLKDNELVEKYRFYKQVQSFMLEADNRLLDQIQDLRDEIDKRKLSA